MPFSGKIYLYCAIKNLYKEGSDPVASMVALKKVVLCLSINHIAVILMVLSLFFWGLPLDAKIVCLVFCLINLAVIVSQVVLFQRIKKLYQQKIPLKLAEIREYKLRLYTFTLNFAFILYLLIRLCT